MGADVLTAYSFSSISTYLQCPRRFEAQYIDKRVKDAGSAASLHGERVHKQAELYIKGESDDLPEQRPKDNILDVLRKLGAEAELKVAVSYDFEPRDFWAKDVMLRGLVDVKFRTRDGVCIIDWKSGKKRDNSLQGSFYAAMMSAYHPGERVQVVFDYLDKGRCPPIDYKPKMRDEVRSLVEMVDGTTAYPPRPTPLCGWCPVADCEFNTKGDRR
jgi:ATP-dependent exoDNAse (exonuclease V) beta subunit